MNIIVRDINGTLIACLQAFMKNIQAKCVTTYITAEHTDIFSQPATAIVSPANSFGYMDGGIDLLYMRRFGNNIETTLKARIAALPMKELLIGETLCLRTNDKDFPWMISAPTMRTPGPIPDAIAVYLSTKAAFLAAQKNAFDTVVMPGMGTLTGRVREDVAARLMLQAYEDVFHVFD